MALLDHRPAPDLPLAQLYSQTFDIPAIMSSYNVYNHRTIASLWSFPWIHKNAKVSVKLGYAKKASYSTIGSPGASRD